MTIALLLTKDDIETTAIGTHYQLKTSGGVVINFTPEAIDELISDIQALRELQKQETEA